MHAARGAYWAFYVLDVVFSRHSLFKPEDGDNDPPKCRLNLTGRHGIISQKKELFKHTRFYLVEFKILVSQGGTPILQDVLELAFYG
jgi:hypothetical protein